MKKIILGMRVGIVILLSTSMSAWAGSLDGLIGPYFTARYFQSTAGYIDFEQVKAITMDLAHSPDNRKIKINFKDGSELEVQESLASTTSSLHNEYKTGFTAFTTARVNLLTAAAGDIGSLETLKIIFQ